MTTRLGKCLIAYQQKFDVDGRVLADQIGINFATLTRLRAGRMCDAEALAKIIAWLISSDINKEEEKQEAAE